MQRRTEEVASAFAGMRLDRFLAEVYPDLSRTLIQRLVTAGDITLDGRPAKASVRVSAGQVVEIRIPEPEPTAIPAESIPLAVVFENSDLLVLDKPAGLVVHPAAGHASGTLVNALLARYPEIAVGTTLRPGIVHRLDKDTSGLMVVAKNDVAQASLSTQIKDRRVLKGYLALVHGHLEASQGTVDAPVGRDPRHRQRMAVTKEGRPARTHFTLRERFAGFDLVEVRLETGRTHQIRVHFAAIGHPVAGDPVYGQADHDRGLTRQFLHACRLGFRLPRSDNWVEFTSPLPSDLEQVLRHLRETSN